MHFTEEKYLKISKGKLSERANYEIKPAYRTCFNKRTATTVSRNHIVFRADNSKCNSGPLFGGNQNEVLSKKSMPEFSHWEGSDHKHSDLYRQNDERRTQI